MVDKHVLLGESYVVGLLTLCKKIGIVNQDCIIYTPEAYDHHNILIIIFYLKFIKSETMETIKQFVLLIHVIPSGFVIILKHGPKYNVI